MINCWQVVAYFDDHSSSWFETIGYFDSLDKAEEMKSKWQDFFRKSKSLFKQPQDWIAEEDPYYPQYQEKTIDFDWHESKQFEIICDNYDLIDYFGHIDIIELRLGLDIFGSSPTFTGDEKKYLRALIKNHNRDYKLNKLLK